LRLGTELGGILPLTEALLVSKLDNELDFKLGTVLGSRLGIELEKGGLGMKLDFKLEIVIVSDLWIVLGASFGYKLGSRLGTELGGRIPKLDFKLGTVLDRKYCTVLVLDIKLGSKL
jgi:hypothetical protein